MNKKTYPHGKETHALIFFDFDETYFPHACTVEQLSMLQQLERYLHDVCSQYHVKIGWVTGSSIAHIESKMKKANLTYLPHFMKAYYDVAHHRTLAFGDSGNDIDMLKAVEHGYLLFNATDEAKGLHDQHASSAYGEGIMEMCQQVFTSMK